MHIFTCFFPPIDCKISKSRDLILIILSFQCFTHRECSENTGEEETGSERGETRKGEKYIYMYSLCDRVRSTLDLEPKHNIFKYV